MHQPVTGLRAQPAVVALMALTALAVLAHAVTAAGQVAHHGTVEPVDVDLNARGENGVGHGDVEGLLGAAEGEVGGVELEGVEGDESGRVGGEGELLVRWVLGEEGTGGGRRVVVSEDAVGGGMVVVEKGEGRCTPGRLDEGGMKDSARESQCERSRSVGNAIDRVDCIARQRYRKGGVREGNDTKEIGRGSERGNGERRTRLIEKAGGGDGNDRRRECDRNRAGIRRDLG